VANVRARHFWSFFSKKDCYSWSPRLSEPDDPDEDEPTSNRGPLAALGVVVLLILGGLWLSHVLGGASATQDCLASGRTNCAPVPAGHG
jgi:hypothetical protein